MELDIIQSDDDEYHKIIITNEIVNKHNWECLANMLGLPKETNTVVIWFKKYKAFGPNSKA